jgi:hypothetical protein
MTSQAPAAPAANVGAIFANSLLIVAALLVDDRGFAGCRAPAACKAFEDRSQLLRVRIDVQ